MAFGVGAFLVMGVADSGSVFLFGIPLLALWGLAMPPIQSIMTQHVDPSEQGRLQGAIGSLGSFAGIFGPYLFAQVFALSIAPSASIHLPGVAFVLSATLMLVGLVIAARVTRHPPPATAPFFTNPRNNHDPVHVPSLRSRLRSRPGQPHPRAEKGRGPRQGQERHR
jgi:DHA1 family tetracycline resistance protein-like MFS transporter